MDWYHDILLETESYEGPISETRNHRHCTEGEGWRFVVEKRKYDRRYKTADDCPLSDPDDSNDALENALCLESAVNGMKLGVRVKCGYSVVEGKASA